MIRISTLSRELAALAVIAGVVLLGADRAPAAQSPSQQSPSQGSAEPTKPEPEPPSPSATSSVPGCVKAAYARFDGQIPAIALAHMDDEAAYRQAYAQKKLEMVGRDALAAACGNDTKP